MSIRPPPPHVAAAAEGYGPVVRVTAKARSDPTTLPVGMRTAEDFGRMKRRLEMGGDYPFLQSDCMSWKGVCSFISTAVTRPPPPPPSPPFVVFSYYSVAT